MAIAQSLRDTYGEPMRVIEVLDRAKAGTALKVMATLARRNFLPLLGSADQVEHVRRAIDSGAVGYVSYGGTDPQLIAAAVECTDGSRLAIPCVTTPGEYAAVMGAKKMAAQVEYASDLPRALTWNKVFPHVKTNPIQPEKRGKVYVWNDYLRRLLMTQAEDNLNFKMLATGFDAPEQALPALRAQHVGKFPIDVAIGPAFSSPEQAFPWCEAISLSQQDSPWHDVLLRVRGKLRNITRIHRSARTTSAVSHV